jgi:pimeloyl-ACP methyl ester carboxylesterase
MDKKVFTCKTPDGINWHVEQTGSGPDILLIPDGLGDCDMFAAPTPLIAKAGFRVTNFDMPGLSRSWEAPESTYTDITPQKLAKYIITLMDELKIQQASIWGCSSGGSTVLALVTEYTDRITSAMAHEVPTYSQAGLEALAQLPDEECSAAISQMIPSVLFGPDRGTWDALGPEFHARLWKNYPKWARGYIKTLGSKLWTDKELLRKYRSKLDWSVGAATPVSSLLLKTACLRLVLILPTTKLDGLVL